MALVFLAQPCYGSIEPESYASVMAHSITPGDVDAQVCRTQSSLLAHGFNTCLAQCLNENRYDYFALLHSDVAAEPGWLQTMVAQIQEYDFDAIHAPCAIKDGKGLTATALAYSEDPWEVFRRITTTEMQTLPEIFDIDSIRAEFDADAVALLPNTGCLVLRIGDWLQDFPGFTIQDKITREDGKYMSRVCSEDWGFGLWCAANGVSVGGTRSVLTKHFGRMSFGVDKGWGKQKVDANYELYKPEVVV